MGTAHPHGKGRSGSNVILACGAARTSTGRLGHVAGGGIPRASHRARISGLSVTSAAAAAASVSKAAAAIWSSVRPPSPSVAASSGAELLKNDMPANTWEKAAVAGCEVRGQCSKGGSAVSLEA